LLDEIRELKTHLEDLISNPTSTRQQLEIISSLNDSLVGAIESSQDALQSELRDLKEPLQVIQSDSDKLLQMSRFNLLSHQSQLWRREQLERLTIASDSIRVSSKKLGEGGFAKVFLGSCPGQAVIAIKQISHDYRESELRAVENEVLLMNCCGSERFLELYGFSHVRDPLQSYSLICVELAVGGALSKFLSTFPASPVSLLFVFLSDIISALEYLHQRRIIHRDVKTDNVLLTDNLRCKLIDFGFAKEQLSSTSGTHSLIGGVVAFLAPEVINREGCCHRSDIYSFAILCCQVLTSRLPDSRMSISDLVSAAVSAVPSTVSSLLQPWLESCLLTNPSHRPSAHALRVKIQELVRMLGNPLAHASGSRVVHADSLIVNEYRDYFHSISADHCREIGELVAAKSEVWIIDALIHSDFFLLLAGSTRE
jgi:serine/threonine protein kinase